MSTLGRAVPIGTAFGWAVFQTETGWQYSAYGRLGGNMGLADTREQAVERAAIALADLEPPRIS